MRKRKKKKEKQPLLTPVSQIAKTITKEVNKSEEEIKETDNLKNIVSRSIEVYNKNLSNNEIEIKSVADLERLIKLQLLLEGKADSRVGKPLNEVEETIIESQQTPILDKDDEEVKSLYEKLFGEMNDKNDN